MRSTDFQQPISKSYLKSLIIRCALVFAGGILLTGIILFFSIQQPLGPSYGESFRILSLLKREILSKSITIYIFTLGVVLVGIVGITLLYSHRVVGPIYRLKMFVQQIAAGDLSKTTSLRQKDVIHSLAEELNILAASYSTRIKTLQEKNNELRKITSQSASKINGEPAKLRAELAGHISEITKIVESLKL